MFDFFKRKAAQEERQEYASPSPSPAEGERLNPSLSENMIAVRRLFDNSADLVDRRITAGGVEIAVLICEGMVNLQAFAELMAGPLTSLGTAQPSLGHPCASPQAALEHLRAHAVLGADQKEFYTYGELFTFIMSGFAVLLIDGLPLGIALGMQGFSFRSISEPSSEVNVRGSREGFVEPLRINLTMIRRRLKSPLLKFELATVGVRSKTDICLVYMTDSVSGKMLDKVRGRLGRLRLDVVLESGYLEPFLEDRPLSLFSGVGTTERPDTLCAKICEGRIAILVDGTPFALIVPYLFNEHFQSVDDYTHRPYYATFIRLLKYTAFFFTILLPGAYVALASFHPELFPNALLFNIATSEESTPFPLMFEALLIHFIYELMREAGLRLPRPIGHAVSIVGALVIGDAAVTAGLIGAPMVMVVAVTAISSFVVPSLYQSITVLRFAFILIGGTLGLFGMTLGLTAVLCNLCAKHPMGVPQTAPASPFSLYPMRDVFARAGWRKLGRRQMRIQDLPGSETDEA
ncbi:MAG: spore germination protein [Provencibacterium sp.]|nr:spore germination protein [Provencibacterium sp.]